MEIKGKIIAALPEVSGISKSGNAWKKREYVLEDNSGQFPRKVAFTCFGDNADRVVLNVGDEATIYFDIESREYNGRWYTDIRCWKAEVTPAGAPGATSAVNVQPQAPVPPAAGEEEFPF